MRAITHEGGVFRSLHESIIGDPVDISDLDITRHSPALIERARRTWESRVLTEFRSIQIMNRFVTEILGAGDPLEVWAPAVDLILDEVRHTALCVSLTRALGGTPRFPDPIELRDPAPYLEAPMAQRAIATAITMLAVNETISASFIEDLRVRCTEPAIRRVLDATASDEEGHQQFGWSYVERSLARFPISTLGDFQKLVTTTLAPHDDAAGRALADVAASARSLDAHDEPELAALGLFGPARQALVYLRCREEVLTPKLRALGLLAPG